MSTLMRMLLGDRQPRRVSCERQARHVLYPRLGHCLISASRNSAPPAGDTAAGQTTKEAS